MCEGSRAVSNSWSVAAAVASSGASWSTTRTRPPGERDPRELGDDALGLRDVMERAVRAREVEGAVGKRQRRPVSLEKLGVRQGPRPGELEQLGHGVEPDDLAHERGEGERERARAGADVERSLVSAQLDEVAHLLREPLRAGVLVLRDALRGAGESVSRRRHGERGPGRS